jgi:hypothetical protein
VADGAAAARDPLGQAEVDELEGAAALGDKEVLRLDVAMDDGGPAVVEVLERTENLQRPCVDLQDTIGTVVSLFS